MSTADQIVAIMRTKGPVLPAQIAKIINTDILIASAHLSDLVSRKIVQISNAKIGGSPIYYLKGQEARLETTAYPHLNTKDQRAFDLLKEKKILKDQELEPLTRVALGNIKDFAEPINVTQNGSTILFWKWKTLDQETTQKEIAKILIPETKKEEKEKQPEIKKEPETKKEQAPAEKKEKPKEEQKQLEPIEKIPEKRIIKPDDFFAQTEEYFKKNKIEIKNFEVTRKNSEIEFIISIPSTMGKLTYYCKAKNKKRLTDSDLSAAFIQGQLKKLPAIIITTGELTKKAEELKKTDEFKAMIIRKV